MNGIKGKDGGTELFKRMKSNKVSRNLLVEPSWIIKKIHPKKNNPKNPNSNMKTPKYDNIEVLPEP